MTSIPARATANKPKRGRWALGIALAAIAAFLLADSRLLERVFPKGYFRDVPPVTALHPVVTAKKEKLVAQAEKIGISIVITNGFRSAEEQDALYRKGRSVEGAIVTNAKGGESYHNYGLAIDFALRTADGGVVWDMERDENQNGQSDWMEVVGIAKRLGFLWGGDWESFPDYPHLQMDFGYSIRELKWGNRPPADAGSDA